MSTAYQHIPVLVNEVIEHLQPKVNQHFFDGTIGGGGQGSFPNLIGSTGKPVGSAYTPAGWSDDTGYVSGAADVALIGGGYDHIVNQLAGTIVGGGHNFIKYVFFLTL